MGTIRQQPHWEVSDFLAFHQERRRPPANTTGFPSAYMMRDSGHMTHSIAGTLLIRFACWIRGRRGDRVARLQLQPVPIRGHVRPTRYRSFP